MSTNGVSSGTSGGKTAAAGNQAVQNSATVGSVQPSGNGNVGISSNHNSFNTHASQNVMTVSGWLLDLY